MAELCLKIYHFFRNHRAIFWLSMITLYILCGYFASKIHLEEDINQLMPSSKNEDGSTKLAFANLRIKDETFLLFEGKDSTPIEHIIETCDAFIDSLTYKNALLEPTRQVVQNIFHRLPDELMFDAIDYLSTHLPAYIDTSVYARLDTMLTYEHIQQQMEINYHDFQSPVGTLFPELIQIDPVGLRNLLIEQIKPFTKGAAGSYQTIDNHFFVQDSSVCVAFITPMHSGTNTGQSSALFHLLNDQIEKFALTNPQVKISYHGTPASGFYNSQQIKTDLKGTITISLLIVLLFIFICFRNYNTIPLLILPLGFGVLFGLAAMYFIKGQFSLLSLGIGAIVLGVALTYVLHILTHYKYVSDPEQILRDQVRPVCLGCLTTIGSFMGLIFVRIELLQDFGLFAILAITGTTAWSLLYLPQFLHPGKNKRNHQAFAIIDRINNYPFDRSKPLITLALATTIICLGYYLSGDNRFDADMHNLGYKAPDITYSEDLLRAKTHTGDKQRYFVSTGTSMEEAIENFTIMAGKLDSLQQLGLVKSYTHTNQIFIPLSIQQQRIQAWEQFWNQERLQQTHNLIQQTAPQAGLRSEAFDPFFELATANYTPEALYEADIIPEGYQSTLMEQSYNGEYLCFTSVRCENDTIRNKDSHYNRICDAIATTPNLLVLDTYYYTTDTLLQLNDDFNALQWISMLFVLLVLFFSFRYNLRHTLLGFLPILLSWLIVLGAMTICNIQFNLINIIISTFIFGIGVDYSIFVMDGLLSGKQNTQLLKHHKTAIFFSAIILITTVSSMLFARHPAIRSVGFPTLIGLISAVGLTYILQPALFRKINKK
ncbi:MAG: MMPL family transporter [Tannerellaceae bacterium]|nr:MMPL family transporter [Tannerellaceae bacterium]